MAVHWLVEKDTGRQTARLRQQHKDKQIEIYVFKDLDFVPFFYDVLSKATYFLEIDYYNVVKDKRYLLHGENSMFANEFE